jgi:hypothetical protein
MTPIAIKAKTFSALEVLDGSLGLAILLGYLQR